VSTERFYTMSVELSNKATQAQPTAFHHFHLSSAKTIAATVSLFVDISLKTSTASKQRFHHSPYPGKGSLQATLQLHGRIDQMICQMYKRATAYSLQAGNSLQPTSEQQPTAYERIPYTVDTSRRISGRGYVRA